MRISGIACLSRVQRYHYGVNELLNDRVVSALRNAGFDRIERVLETGSTNADLLEPAFDVQPSRAALRWANHQTAGRGRRGTQWVDETGRCLTFSVALEYAVGTALPTPLPAFALVAGLAVMTAAEPYRADPLPPIQLKWPNDLVLGDGKLAGLLIEARQQGSIGRIVIGCGLNLLPPGGFQPTGTSLAAAGLLTEREGWSDNQSQQLVASIAMALQSHFNRFCVDGLAPFREHWQAANYFAGKPVRLHQDGQPTVTGHCCGIDAGGALQIESAGIITSYSIGVVSARRVDDPAIDPSEPGIR